MARMEGSVCTQYRSRDPILRAAETRSGRVVTGIPGGFLAVSAGFGLGKRSHELWEWAGVREDSKERLA
ncbi:hypothetical protein CDL15_Pgr004913 [Punica granatum]|uniref:Uncharacterized protein n=1 Tax=Punica granatum TaxID=22663 RepID=A0A218Y4R9_PUNGR|nr:hypothetical protein CDL15_Pgr004913 [Punica granatum]